MLFLLLLVFLSISITLIILIKILVFSSTTSYVIFVIFVPVVNIAYPLFEGDNFIEQLLSSFDKVFTKILAYPIFIRKER